MGNDTIKYGVRDGIVWIHPVNRLYISSAFGYRWHPVTGERKMHRGLDLPAPKGTDIRAARGGNVTVATFNSSAGNYVMIDHGDGYKSVYMHMTHYTVHPGQYVNAGDVIGFVGSTGSSTGYHLHFGICVTSNKAHLLESIDSKYKYQKNRGGDIYVDPNLFAKFTGGYKEDTLSNIVDTSEHPIWIDKQVPAYDSWIPMFPNYSYKIKNNGQIGNLLSRRGHLISNSSKILFEHGKVNSDIGLGYNFVGINSYHPPIEISPIHTVEWDKLTALGTHINHNIAKVGGQPKKGELTHEDQNTVASYILSYLCNHPNPNRRWTPNAVIAMLGNMVGESGLNPARWEDDVRRESGDPNIKKGFGLVQWTPWSKHWAWCKNNGYSGREYDIESQLEHIQDEFFGSGGQYIILTNNKYVTGYYNQFSHDPFYTGAVRDYIDNNYYSGNPRLVPIKPAEFPMSNLPVEVLTIGFATNYERPAIRHIRANVRVENSVRFARLFGKNHYESRTSMPDSSTDNQKSYWIPSGVRNKGIMGTNPYLSNLVKHISDGGKFVNNGYAWGRSAEILFSYKELTGVYTTLCSDHAICWFDYNKDKNYYEYDKMPRVGSLICWENLDASSLSDEPKSYIGVVEEVIGSDVIKISKMDSTPISVCEFTLTTIDNSDNNWGLNRSKYLFKGFIHLLPQNMFYPNISLSEDGSLSIRCSSNTGKSYASILFGLTDIKHFNRMKIEYDLEISPPSAGGKKLNEDGNENDPLVTILDRLDDHCNFYIHMSQQVISCEPTDPTINVNWPGTYFPKRITSEEESDGINMGPPFPDGVVLLSSYSKHDLTDRSKFNLLTGSYVFTDMSKTIQLNRCIYEGKGAVTTFEEDSNLRKFNREKQTYIGLSVVSEPVSVGDARYETSVTVRIKKIILYG